MFIAIESRNETLFTRPVACRTKTLPSPNCGNPNMCSEILHIYDCSHSIVNWLTSMGNAERIILDLLARNGEAYQSDLVRQSGFSRSRISEVLSSLEESGLVTRIPLGKNFRVIITAQVRKRRVHSGKEALRLGIIRASEYPFVLPFEKLLREKLNIKLSILTYDNGIDLSRDLSLLRLDLGIAPVLTHFMFFSIGSPIKMIAPAGSGGATIL